MSKIDDLHKLFVIARHRHATIRDDGDRAGIAAVVRALRDEMGQSLAEVARQECCGRGTATRFSEQTECCDCPDLLVTTEQVSNVFNEILGDAGNEKVAGGSTREDEKAVEAAGDKGPVTVNSPATDPCPDCGGRKYLAKHALNGTYYVHCHCPKLKATDPAPAVCVWTRLDPNRVDYRIACAPDPSTIYHPHPQRLASANCANCGKPITFTEANHG